MTCRVTLLEIRTGRLVASERNGLVATIRLTIGTATRDHIVAVPERDTTDARRTVASMVEDFAMDYREIERANIASDYVIGFDPGDVGGVCGNIAP